VPIPGLVPAPARLRSEGEALRLSADATVAGPPEATRLARRLLGTATGFPLPAGGETATIRLTTGALPGGPESYRLRVEAAGVRVVGASGAALVNGLHTLVQLLPPDILRPAVVRGAEWTVPAVEVEDAPRCGWRGVHLDVARHFMPAGWLLRFVELLALHKLNVLHLHLSDDQGWRFPSERFPRLVEVGSWRSGTPVGYAGEGGYDLTPHGGYYTRRELADLVAFAAERNVIVVPEIDLPGHVAAVLAAYPELGNGTGPYRTWTHWGINRQVLNVDEATVRFCAELFGEVADVFPGPFIHVGGDEVPTDEWRASPSVQRRKAELGLAGERQLQHWFTGQLHAALTGRGRRLVGWDEILEGGDPPEGAVVMSWRGAAGGLAGARAGCDVVMCPEQPLYLDHYQSDDPDEPLAIGGGNTLADVCAFDPVVAGLDGAVDRVLGAQVQLWTEYLPDPRAVEYMAFPRAAAFADTVWAPAGGDPAEREARVISHLGRLDVLGVGYRPPAGPHPWQRGGEGRRRRQGLPEGVASRKS
jgi:hexosaminidase